MPFGNGISHEVTVRGKKKKQFTRIKLCCLNNYFIAPSDNSNAKLFQATVFVSECDFMNTSEVVINTVRILAIALINLYLGLFSHKRFFSSSS